MPSKAWINTNKRVSHPHQHIFTTQLSWVLFSFCHARVPCAMLLHQSRSSLLSTAGRIAGILFEKWVLFILFFNFPAYWAGVCLFAHYKPASTEFLRLLFSSIGLEFHWESSHAYLVVPRNISFGYHSRPGESYYVGLDSAVRPNSWSGATGLIQESIGRSICKNYKNIAWG